MPRVTIGGVTVELPRKFRGFTDGQSELLRQALQSVETLSEEGGVAADVTAYGATGDGVTDDTDAINEAIAAASASSTAGRRIHFPPGTYKVSPPTGTVQEEAAFTIPSNFRVTGDPGSEILMTGQPSDSGPATFFYHVFVVLDGSENIVFDGISVRGENNPFVYTYNNASSAIDIRLTNTKDVTVRNCTFTDLHGFSIHDRGSNLRVHAFNNFMYRCSNGMNINADYSVQAFNVMIESEGIEFSGSYATVAHNTLIDVLGVGISAGGDLLTFKPGNQVVHNLISGCTEVSGQYGIGIIAAENFGRSSISYNHISNCDLHGIVLAGHAGVKELQIHDNHILSCGLVGEGGIGIDVSDNGGRHSIIGNKSRDLGTAGYSQSYGLILRAPDCRVQNNDFKGTNHDASYSATALRTLERDNRYENSSQEVFSATFVDPSYAWRGA